jgi:hypothetical protein
MLVVGPRIPTINQLTGGFKGGIRTNFGSFIIPRHYKTGPNIDSTFESEDNEEDDNYRSPAKTYNSYNRPIKKFTTTSKMYLL